MVSNIIAITVANFTVVLILMAVDLITGVVKALKKHSIRSAKLRNSLNKAVIYFVILLIGSCITSVGEFGAITIFVSFLCIVEAVSILENLNAIFPKANFIKKIVGYLESECDNKMKKYSE